ncbi:hypothetical protein [Methanopyrus sp. KOL6]|uniref:hypothetical protein n=1 Tax=Methanopyrus sp. KOL6 TaxID=1937004 RepID=UPI000B4B2FC0|nr:hypothetical protein [Methanopyrus sp. KOL6]
MKVPTVCYRDVHRCETSEWSSYEEYLDNTLRDIVSEEPEVLRFEIGGCRRDILHAITAFDVLFRLYRSKRRVGKVMIDGTDVTEMLKPIYEQVFSNYDVVRAKVGVPERHRHIRTEIEIRDGRKIVFQEATMSNLLRAFVTVKTRPDVVYVELKRKKFDVPEYSEWQLVETSTRTRRR